MHQKGIHVMEPDEPTGRHLWAHDDQYGEAANHDNNDDDASMLAQKLRSDLASWVPWSMVKPWVPSADGNWGVGDAANCPGGLLHDMQLRFDTEITQPPPQQQHAIRLPSSSLGLFQVHRLAQGPTAVMPVVLRACSSSGVAAGFCPPTLVRYPGFLVRYPGPLARQLFHDSFFGRPSTQSWKLLPDSDLAGSLQIPDPRHREPDAPKYFPGST